MLAASNKAVQNAKDSKVFIRSDSQAVNVIIRQCNPLVLYCDYVLQKRAATKEVELVWNFTNKKCRYQDIVGSQVGILTKTDANKFAGHKLLNSLGMKEAQGGRLVVVDLADEQN